MKKQGSFMPFKCRASARFMVCSLQKVKVEYYDPSKHYTSTHNASTHCCWHPAQVDQKQDEAEKLCNEALSIYERVLGKDHPSTLASLEKLASVLQVCGLDGL